MRAWKSVGVAALLTAASCVQVLGGDNPYNAGEAAGGGGQAGGAGGAGGASSSSTGGAGGTSEPCEPGETRPCYSGPAGTEGVGDCKGGKQFCADDGSEFGPCEDEVVPAATEDCNLPGDEDCNGEAQDVGVCTCEPGQPAPCSTGLAGICAAGMGTCSADGKTVESCMTVNKPRFDDCTTAEDEDCDGVAIAMCTGAVGAGFVPPGKNTDPMDDAIYDVAFTPDGGYVVAGTVDAALGADLFSFSANQGSVYVAKVGADGQVQWAKTYPASEVGVARGVAVDSAGRITVVGEFSGTMNLGGGNLQSQNTDIFMVQLDAAGVHVWSQNIGATNTQSAQDVDVDAAGNLYVTGFLTSDAVSLGGNILDPNMEDVFLASYDFNGNHRWSRVMGDSNNQRGRRLTVTKDGNIALVGETDSGANLGGGNMNGGGGRDIIVGMYAGATGNHLWSKLFGSSGDQFYGNIASAPNGNVLVTGRFTGSLDFGGAAMSAAGAADVYVAELAAASGNHVNSKRFGISGTSRGTGIAVDGAGNVVVAGHFDDSIDFGAGTINTGYVNDVFVVKLAAADWSPLWTRKFGLAGTQTAWAAAVDGKGDVVVGGSFEQQLFFGAPLGTITSSGGADLFSVRIAP
ncbi:hypothetical protein [Polyangium sp. 15x6]|uniref:hypothetical protein n=1 Tax=Polyangium sp. 15x6 TaxID=3042687 RepID=UPI00249CDC27|nr:hypothetical protein [Polyangium sp. 15x6]MDI3290377.1 hypothetical protein [Polyangium sp. 15x6]